MTLRDDLSPASLAAISPALTLAAVGRLALEAARRLEAEGRLEAPKRSGRPRESLPE